MTLFKPWRSRLESERHHRTGTAVDESRDFGVTGVLTLPFQSCVNSVYLLSLLKL